MGLSRGGGGIAFQKVVSKVSDLPSPIDAEPGQRIIVRETEEVYGLNLETRMWEVIGTVKKVGGLRPEELKAHVEGADNPHKTSLQQVLDTGSEAKVTQSIVIRGKVVRDVLGLLDRGALRYGPEAGDAQGLLWLNAGNGKETFLRVVNGEGQDLFVVGSDGLVSGGAATFYGGFKGRAEFDDEIVAKEGIESAEGYDLVLSGDKGVLFKAGGKDVALLTHDALVLQKELVTTDLTLSGQVRGDLVPVNKVSQLGADRARWAAFLAGADVNDQLVIRVGANSQTSPLHITGPVPGDGVVITAAGELGLGTDKPEARLDVRGDVLVASSLRLTGEGVSCGDWSTTYGAKLHIDYKGKTVLTGGPDGLVLSAGAKVSGDLTVAGNLAIGGVAGMSGEEIAFRNGAASYKATTHAFVGGLTVTGAVALPGVKIDGGDVRAKGAVYADSASVDVLSVGGVVIKDASVTAPGVFAIDADTLQTKSLNLSGRKPEITVVNELTLKGDKGTATFSMGGPNCGILFEGKHWELLGLNALNVDKLGTGQLAVDGGASFLGGKASISDKGLRLAGELSVGGLALKKVEEEVEFDGLSAKTKFKIPVGVRVEAVLIKPLGEVKGARFIQAGDDRDLSRFLAPTTDLKGTIRGLAHWDRGLLVQKYESPVVVSADAAASGRLLVTVHYVDAAAL
ncbi:MAG: choice-of-anchor A family protein [Nitrospira sp.]